MIAFDIDDTVIDTYTVARQCMIDDFNYDIHPRLKHNNYVPGVKYEEMVIFIQKVLSESNDKLLVYKDADKALFKIQDLIKSDIYFITARDDHLKEVTEDLLNMRFPGLKYKLVLSTKTEKAALLDKFNLKYMVEDRLWIANNCTNAEKVFLVKQDWNQGRPINDNVIPVDNLMEIYNYLVGVYNET